MPILVVTDILYYYRGNALIERFNTIDTQNCYQQADDLFRLMNELQKIQLTAITVENISTRQSSNTTTNACTI